MDRDVCIRVPPSDRIIFCGVVGLAYQNGKAWYK